MLKLYYERITGVKFIKYLEDELLKCNK